MRIFVIKTPKFFGNSFAGLKSASNKQWEALPILWCMATVTALIIAFGVLIVYLTPFCIRTGHAATPAGATDYTSVKAVYGGLNTYWSIAQQVDDELLLSETSNAVVSDDQQGKLNQLKFVCYYTFPGEDDLTPEKIDSFLCTHINIASVGIKNNKLELLTEKEQHVIQSVLALRSQNKYLKVLLCVGGDPLGYAVMVSKLSTRRMFINDLLSTMSYYSFDGVDFDWEFPAWSGKSSERKKFVIFLKELQATVQKKKLNIIVSVAVAAPQTVIDVSYDIPEMNRYIDYVNLMAYDYHFYTKYLPLTGPNAPLYSLPNDKGYLSTLNTNWSSVYWHVKGMPKNKIVVGIPTYGHSFRLMNADNHGWSAPASDFGKTGKGGFVSYSEVCQFLRVNGSTHEFDANMDVPYAYRALEWLSYEDVLSISYKAKYITSGSYGGAMVFSLNEDDHQGVCAGTTFLLTRQIKNILGIFWH